jgi:hypothetical protein
MEFIVSKSKVPFGSKLTTCLALFLALFLIHSSDVAAQMTGTPRSNFINDYYKGCYSAQRKAAQNTDVPDSLLKKYCSCLSTYLADSTNNEQVNDMALGNLPLSQLTPARQLAERYCGKQVLGNNYRNPN